MRQRVAQLGRGRIDVDRITRQWPDILRVVASIHTGVVAAQGVLRILSPGGTPTTAEVQLIDPERRDLRDPLQRSRHPAPNLGLSLPQPLELRKPRVARHHQQPARRVPAPQ